MLKPESLRAWLLASVKELQKHPDKLQLFIDIGNLAADLQNYSDNISFEYRYTLNLIVTDFSVHVDYIMVPLLAWVKQNQIDMKREDIQFEADVIDTKRVDLDIKLPLTERVIVSKDQDGNYTTTHAPEPLPEWNGPKPAALAELIVNE